MQEIKTVVLPLTEITVKKKEMHSKETGEMVVSPIEKAIQEYLDQGWTYHSMSIVPGVVLRKRNWFKRTFSSKPQERFDASYYTLFFVREKTDFEPRESTLKDVEPSIEPPKKKHLRNHKAKEQSEPMELTNDNVKTPEIEVEQATPIEKPNFKVEQEAPVKPNLLKNLNNGPKELEIKEVETEVEVEVKPEEKSTK